MSEQGTLLTAFRKHALLDVQCRDLAEFIMGEVQLLSKDLEERGQDFSYAVRFTRDGNSYDQREPIIGADNKFGMQVCKLRSGKDPVPVALVHILPWCESVNLCYPDGTLSMQSSFSEVAGICSRLGDLLYAAVSQDERYALSAAFPVDSLEP